MGHTKRTLVKRLSTCLLASILTIGMVPVPTLAYASDAIEEVTTDAPSLKTQETLSNTVRAENETRVIDGDVSVSESDKRYAVLALGKGTEGVATVSISGNVTNTMPGDASGSRESIKAAYAYGYEGGKANLSVGGSVTCEPSGTPAASSSSHGVYANADTGDATVDITGDVTVRGTGDTCGIELRGSGASPITGSVKVGGDVTATSTAVNDNAYDAFGIDTYAAGSSTTSVEVGGSVRATAQGSNQVAACGVFLNCDAGAKDEVTVHGNIEATGIDTSAGAKVSTLGGSSTLIVDGDVRCTSEATSTGVWLESFNGGTCNVMVKGTVHGNTHGLLFDASEKGTFDVTVWKVETEAAGTPIARKGTAVGLPDDLNSQVSYFIKAEQPQAGGTLRLVDESGAALREVLGTGVAHAGDKVYLDVALEPGYTLEGAYNGVSERVALSRDERGFFVVVPEGGGVYLTLKLARIAEGGMSVQDGMAQPFCALSNVRADGYTNATSEIYRFVVYVETDYDTDKDGKCDLVKTYVQVPRAAVHGAYRAPVVFEADPYSAGMRTWNFFSYGSEALGDEALTSRPAHRAPSSSTSSASLALDPTLTRVADWNYEIDGMGPFPQSINELDYFLARGFAVVRAAGLGTYGSEGLECCGTVMERDAFANVVEWLHGTTGRHAFADAAGTIEVTATDWSSGRIAMMGLSYPGAMCYEVATSGVEGLETVVPVAGPASWYDGSNHQGISTESLMVYNYTSLLADTCASRLFLDPDATLLNRYQSFRTYMRDAQVALQGDYGPYWQARDFYTGQSSIKASGLIVMGLNDQNVNTKQFDLMRRAFIASGSTVKVLLHQNAHVTPNDTDAGTDIMIGDHTYLEWLNLWFTHELLGVDNEVATMPSFTVQSNVDGTFYKSERWDEDDAVNLWPATGGETTVAAAGAHMNDGELIEHTFTGSASDNAALWTMVTDEDVTIAGKVCVQVRAKVDDVSPGDIPLSAVLLDACDEPFKAFGVNGDIENEVVSKGTADTPLNCDIVRWKQGETKRKIITTGHIDLRNPEAGYEPATATRRDEPIEANKYHDYTIWLDPTYYTVQAGHRLELYLVPFCGFTLDQPIDKLSAEQRSAILGRHGLDDVALMHLRTDYHVTIDDAASHATVPVSEEVRYVLTAGDGSTWKDGSSSAPSFTWKRTVHDSETIRHLQGVTVDGALVTRPSYEATAGSAIVSLAPPFLEDLAAGTHEIAALFDDGRGEAASFTVVRDSTAPSDPTSPKTDHTSSGARGSSSPSGVTTVGSGFATSTPASSASTRGNTSGTVVKNDNTTTQTKLASTADLTPQALPALTAGLALAIVARALRERVAPNRSRRR